MIVTDTYLPCSHATDAAVTLSWFEEVRMRSQPFESSVLFAVMIMFPSKEIKHLNVSTMIDSIPCDWTAERRTRVLQRVNQVFGLERKGVPYSNEFSVGCLLVISC